MTVTSTARLLSPEEIAVKAGEQVPYVRLPEPASAFADRALRLRQRASGHAMRDFLLFAAQLTEVQHELLKSAPELRLPDGDALKSAAELGQPPLPATGWPRDGAWLVLLRELLDKLQIRLKDSPALGTIQALAATDDIAIERQADRLLAGVMLGLDFASAPLIAAALQVYWTALVLQIQACHGKDRLAPFGRTDVATACPCCGSRPTASITRIGGDGAGHRYLHCSLCATQWHMVRIKCSACESTKGIGYQGLIAKDEAQAAEPSAAGAARRAKGGDSVQAETCDECGRYLKIVHMERDPHVDPMADDLASLTLDLLVSDSGLQRHGVNLMLLFGDAEPNGNPDGDHAADGASVQGSPPTPAGPPPDPGAA